MYIVSRVDTTIPPTTAVPMAIRWLQPSPVANASGISPKTVEALVNSQRHCQHDNQWIFETFKLGCQNQVNQKDSQDKGEHQTGRTFTIFFRVSRQGGAESIVQCFLGNLIHLVQTLPDCFSICQSCRNRS